MGIFLDEFGDIKLGSVIISGLIGVTALFSGCYIVTNNWKVSDGERTGMINKVSKRGYFWKTYEGQMALEGITSGGGSVGANIWNFSLDNNREHGENIEGLADKLRTYMDSGTKVKIKYIEMAGTWPWRSSTDYLIQNVEPVSIERANEQKPTKLERESTTTYSSNKGEKELILDGRKYLFKHDQNGKLKIVELKDVQ